MYISLYLSSYDIYKAHLFSDSTWYDISCLKALLYLLPTPHSKLRETGPQRLKKIFVSVEYGDDIMDTVRIVAEDCKKDFHPLMVIGLTKGLPIKYYVVAFEVIHDFITFTAAFDNLFKSFFVYNVHYPQSVEGLYTFIQKFMYEIKSDGDKVIASVNDLITILDNTKH